MVNAEDVISIYVLVSSSRFPLWLNGGWGIDALLGEQTRPHHDLDVFVLLEHVQPMQALLADQGYHLKEIWEENRWVLDLHDHQVATAFVLWDSQGREFDAHALQLDDQGNGIPAGDVPAGVLPQRLPTPRKSSVGYETVERKVRLDAPERF